ELAAASLAQEYRAEAEGPAVHDLVEVVTGASAVAHRFAQVRLGAVVEVCALLTEVSQGEAVQPRPGVAHRVVIERETLAASPSAAAPPRGAQLRVADRVPGGLLVADRRLGIVPLTARGSEPAALVVHGCGLLDSLLGLFEAVWREALPLRLAGGGAPGPAGTPGAAGAAGGGYEEVTTGPDATDLEILSLLLAGMTDARVAKRLDLGLRTVQRRVKGLMELAGVTTRLQLGWHAYAKGWVAREPLG
ncbi:helix-turn-helix transcriptional regulator, partial [Streptomyces clavuligerus]